MLASPRARDLLIVAGVLLALVLAARGFPSVAAEGFQASGVVVCHTESEALSSGRAFAAEGLQIAAGVPLRVGEPDGFRTFRIGLFGLDKLLDVDGTLARFEKALDRVLASEGLGHGAGGTAGRGEPASGEADLALAERI